MALPIYQAAGTAVAGFGGDLTVSWPTHLTGDIGFLVVNSDVGFDTPSGWAHILGSPNTNTNAPACVTAIFWKRAASDAEANVVAHGVADNYAIARISTVRGVIASGDPWDVTATG